MAAAPWPPLLLLAVMALVLLLVLLLVVSRLRPGVAPLSPAAARILAGSAAFEQPRYVVRRRPVARLCLWAPALPAGPCQPISLAIHACLSLHSGRQLRGARRGQPPAVLVTGGCGFLGRHVLAELRTAGWRCLSVDRVPPHAAHRLPG